MRVVHIAIPTHDLDASENFYTNVIGAILARRYSDRVTINFFDHQIVCHLAPNEIPTEIKPYPRHFGITFTDHSEFKKLYQRIKDCGWPLFQELWERWPDKPERHETFFIADPSNNLLEFKFYFNSKFVY